MTNPEKSRISAVVAIAGKNRVIGNEGDLAVRIADDLKRFKQITSGHPIIMGRKTYESIGRALPGRTNIILTRDPDYSAEDCAIVHSVEEALEAASESPGGETEVFIIGGGEIYKAFFAETERLYLTVIDTELHGDTHFPDYSDFTKEVEREEHFEHNPPYTYLTLDK